MDALHRQVSILLYFLYVTVRFTGAAAITVFHAPSSKHNQAGFARAILPCQSDQGHAWKDQCLKSCLSPRTRQATHSPHFSGLLSARDSAKILPEVLRKQRSVGRRSTGFRHTPTRPAPVP